MSKTSVHMRCVAASACAVLSVSAHAAADPPPKANIAGDAAAAQSLFYEARSLMRDGNYAVACPKLEESLRLEYGMGTEFNLADCNEKIGKIASAWSGFTNVAAAAKAQNQAAREKLARDRAKALEPRIPKLVIEPLGQAAGDLEVKRDGLVVSAASFGTPMAVDPGSHQLTASAPGKQTWEGTITAPEGKTVKVSIPPLTPAITNVPPPTAAPVSSAPPPDIPQPWTEPLAATFPEPVVEHRSTQKTVGYVIGAAGIAGVAVGLGFGVDSLQKHDAAKSHCTGDLCDARGVELRKGAIDSGNVATIVGLSGAGALLGGAILVLTAPSAVRRKEPARGFHLAPHVATSGAGFSLQGVFQ